MLSKILIDVNEKGAPVLRLIRKIQASGDFGDVIDDVRDKLVDRFIQGKAFAVIRVDESPTHSYTSVTSMDAMDILEDLLSMYKPRISNPEHSELFEKSIYNLGSLLEIHVGVKSNQFLKDCKEKAQV